jgi:hypothetical protein
MTSTHAWNCFEGKEKWCRLSKGRMTEVPNSWIRASGMPGSGEDVEGLTVFRGIIPRGEYGNFWRGIMMSICRLFLARTSDNEVPDQSVLEGVVVAHPNPGCGGTPERGNSVWERDSVQPISLLLHNVLRTKVGK